MSYSLRPHCSTSGFPVLHIESGDAIQLSHPLSLPSPPAFSLFQHQVIFPVSPLFTSGGQSIGASVLPMNIRGWFPLVLTSLISLLSKHLKRLLQYHNSKASVLQLSAFFMVQFSHPFSTTEKTIVWLYRPLMAKWSLWFLIHCLGLS